MRMRMIDTPLKGDRRQCKKCGTWGNEHHHHHLFSRAHAWALDGKTADDFGRVWLCNPCHKLMHIHQGMAAKAAAEQFLAMDNQTEVTEDVGRQDQTGNNAEGR